MSAPGSFSVLPSTTKNNTIPSFLWPIAVRGAVPHPPLPRTFEALPFIIKNGPNVTPSLIFISWDCFTVIFPNTSLSSCVNPINPPEPFHVFEVINFPPEYVIPKGFAPLLLKLGSSNPPPFIAINASLSFAICVKYCPLVPNFFVYTVFILDGSYIAAKYPLYPFPFILIIL